MTADLLICIPTYGHFDYAAAAAESAIRNTTLVRADILIVDDASKGFKSGVIKHLLPLIQRRNSYRDQRIRVRRFARNGGLTRSWNLGLETAISGGYRYACVTNSDVLFPVGWEEPLLLAVDREGISLVGPVTNTPGNCYHQHVKHFSEVYKKVGPSDSFEDINRVIRDLVIRHRGRMFGPSINGFCMLARSSEWDSGRFDRDNVFRPYNEYYLKGGKNPTPTMTVNEEELQARWKALGRKIRFCPDSYVFHYRAVSRGSRYRRGDWVRRS